MVKLGPYLVDSLGAYGLVGSKWLIPGRFVAFPVILTLMFRIAGLV
jgi:hypothetical protein